MRCTGMTARLLACRTLENIVTTIRECQQTGPGNFERLYNYNSINFNSKMSGRQLLQFYVWSKKYYYFLTLQMVRLIITGLKTLYTQFGYPQHNYKMLIWFSIYRNNYHIRNKCQYNGNQMWLYTKYHFERIVQLSSLNNSRKVAKFYNDIPIKRHNQQINMNATEYFFCSLHTETVVHNMIK